MDSAQVEKVVKSLGDKPTLKNFNEQFGIFVQGPSGFEKIRKLILELAISGKLSRKLPSDQLIQANIDEISKIKINLIENKVIRKQKELPEIKSEDIPFNIPNHWVWAYLSNISFLENGDRSKNYPNKSALVDDGVPFVNAGHLQKGVIDKNEMTFITNERYEILRSGKFKNGDILYCLRGSLGKSAIIRNLDKGAIASSLVIIRLYGEISPEYLLKYFGSPLSQQMIKKYDNGTAQPNLSATDLSKFLIPFPPLEEQKRIVTKVDELMALCDQLEAQQQQQANTLLKANTTAIRALLSAESSQFKKNKEDKQNPQNKKPLDSHLTEKDKNGFNKAWERIANNFHILYGNSLPMPPGEGRQKKYFVGLENVKQLRQVILFLGVTGNLTGTNKSEMKELKIKDVFQLIDGDRGQNYPKKHDYQDNGYCLFLSTKNVRKDGFLFEDCVFISKDKHEQLRKGVLNRGDLLITTRGTLGNVAVFDNSVPFDVVRINSGMLILRPKIDGVNATYFSYYVQSPVFFEQLNEMRTGSAQPQIPVKILKEFLLPLPSEEEQKRIVANIDSLMTLCDRLEKQLKTGYSDAEKLIDATLKELVA